MACGEIVDAIDEAELGGPPLCPPPWHCARADDAAAITSMAAKQLIARFILYSSTNNRAPVRAGPFSLPEKGAWNSGKHDSEPICSLKSSRHPFSGRLAQLSRA